MGRVLEEIQVRGTDERHAEHRTAHPIARGVFGEYFPTISELPEEADPPVCLKKAGFRCCPRTFPRWATYISSTHGQFAEVSSGFSLPLEVPASGNSQLRPGYSRRGSDCRLCRGCLLSSGPIPPLPGLGRPRPVDAESPVNAFCSPAFHRFQSHAFLP